MGQYRVLRSGAPAAIAALALLATAASAQSPPYWPGGTNYPVASWPTDSEWFPYTHSEIPIADPRTNDPSNGGATPQAHVNVSSGCPDQTLPSIYVGYKVFSGQPTAFFRWRVESAPNNYTSGGAYGSTDPWNSALYTVLVDINGDGYRDFAFHLDGSSGAPATPIDRVRGVYSTTLNQSVDYLADPTNILVTGTNPAAFVQQNPPNAGWIENFQNTLNPAPTWPAGATSWDYGTTRTVDISTPTCTEYFVDYQIPIGDGGFFDARPVGGPEVVYGSTPIALGFVTSNSLNNSLQKDAALNFPYTACMTCPYPFGDFIVLEQLTTRKAPVVWSVAASGCGPATITARVSDAVKMVAGAAVRTVTAVEIRYYYDANANGLADDAGSWTFAANASAVVGTLDRWTASWDSTSLARGQYLLGVKATDENGNIAWSYLTQAEAVALGQPPNYANPVTDPGIVTGTFNNTCGSGATISKTGNTTTPVAGGTIDFTLTVFNSLGTAITLSSLSDVLPTSSFTFDSNQGGTLPAPTTSPSFGDQSLTWTFSPAATIPALSSRTLVFRVNLAPLTPTGTYQNSATAVTSDGTKRSSPFTFTVGTPSLTVAKSSSNYNPNPGATFTYSITVTNDSPVGVTSLVVTDVLPAGLTFVSASDGGTESGGTVTWNLGALAGVTSRTVTYTVTVQNPFPNNFSNALLNSVTADSAETSPVTTSATVLVNVVRPILFVEKSAGAIAYPGLTIVWTIKFQNIGLADATSVTITDTIPAGFTYSSCTTPLGTCSQAGGVVTWNIGNLTVAAGLQTATVTFNVSNPYTGADPAQNTAVINGQYGGSALPSASSTAQVAVSLLPPACATPTDVRYFKANGPPLTNPFPLSTTAGAAEVVRSVVSTGTGTQEVATFIDPNPEPVYTAISTVTVYATTDRIGGNLDGSFQIIAYDPGNNPTVLATSPQIVNLFTNTKQTVYWTFTGTMVVPAGWRLAVRVNLISNQPNRTANLYFDAGATSSRVTFCERSFLSAVEKSTSLAAVEAGQSFSYSIRYSNVMSDVTLSNARVVDTLPTGVTFVSATIAPDGGGSTAANCSQAGQVVTCGVQSAAVPPAPPATGGTLAGCGTGSPPAQCGGVLTMNVQVNAPLGAGILQLDNSVQLLSTQAPASSATATTRIIGPKLSLLKAVSAATAFAGDPITYTITVLNIGTAAANSVQVQDVLAANLTYTSCAFVPPATGACSAAGQTVTWNLTGSLSAGGSAQVTVTVGTASVVPPATVTDSATATAQGSAPANTVSATSNTVSTTFLTVPNLSIGKSGARVPPGVIGPGDTVQYQISVTNTGGTTATNVFISDPIPANTTYVNGSVSGSPGTALYDLPGNQVTLSVGSLAQAATATLTFRVTVGALPAGNTTLTNTATVTAGNAVTRSATATNTATATPALTLSKSGPDMNSVALTTLTAPASGTNLVQVASTAGFFVGDNVSIGGTIRRVTAIGANTLTLSGNVTAPSGATVYNLATGGPVPYQLTTLAAPAAGVNVTVLSTQYLNVNDYVSINATNVQITAIAGTNLTLSAPVFAPVGTPVRPIFPYTLTYENTGNAVAASTTITDTLPVGLTYISSYPAVCGAVGQVVTCNMGSVSPGTSGSVTIYVLPGGGGTYANSATATATGAPVATSNNVRTDVGGLRVAKTTSTPNLVNNGAAVATYTIRVDNDAAIAANGVLVTDSLPTGFTYRPGTTVVNGAPAGDPGGPPVAPVWGPFVIAGGGTLTIQFGANLGPAVGAGTYNNPVAVTSTNVPVSGFDELGTTAEDVAVTVPTDFRVTASVTVPSPCFTPCNATLRFTVSNVGSSDGANVPINIAAFDPSITIVGGLPPGVTGSGNGPFLWTVASLVRAATCTGTPPNICTATVTFNIQLTTLNSLSQCATVTMGGDVNPSNDTGCGALAPTSVSLASFAVRHERRGAEVAWETAGESGSLGFHLYRQEGSAWVPVTRSLLPALLTSPAGASYRVVDARALPGVPMTYLLVEQELGGGRVAYGPFRFGAAPAGAAAPPAGRLDTRPGLFASPPAPPEKDGSESPAEVAFESAPIGPDAAYGARVTRALAEKGAPPVKGSTTTRFSPAVKVLVSADGLYFLDARTVAPLLTVSEETLREQIATRRLALFHRGLPVAWLPAANGSGLYFWGQGLRNTYTSENVYWLRKGSGLAMSSSPAATPATVSPDQVFTGSAHAEVDAAPGRGATEAGAIGVYWKFLYGGLSGYDRYDFPVELEEPSSGSGQATVMVHVYGRTSSSVNPDHRFTVSVNGISVGTQSWDGEGFHDVTLTFPASYLRAGANTVGIVASAPAGVTPNTLEYVDFIDVTYPRRYRTATDLLACRGDGNATVTAAGFSSGSAVVLDVTDPRRPAVRPASVSPAGAAWEATFLPASPDVPYVVTTLSVARVPKELRASTMGASLLSRAARADWVVLTVPALAEAAGRLAARREAQGLETKVVTVEEVMDAFSGGIPDPRAMRDFVTYATASWAKAPRYLLLAGDGSYDYRNVLGQGGNLVPTVMVATPFGSSASDTFFGDVDGDGVPEVAVGRLPVLSAAELDAVTAKIAAYEDSPRTKTDTRLVLLADRGDPAAGPFPEACDDVAALAEGLPIEKIYRDVVDVETARARLLEDLRAGAGFLTFSGHSSLYWLSVDKLLQKTDVPSLANKDRLPLVSATTCFIGAFQLPGYESLGEKLISEPTGGAAAVVSSTNLSMDMQARALTLELHRALLGPSAPAVGDAFRAGLAEFVRLGAIPWMARTYVLLGDPAMRVRVPGR